MGLFRDWKGAGHGHVCRQAGGEERFAHRHQQAPHRRRFGSLSQRSKHRALSAGGPRQSADRRQPGDQGFDFDHRTDRPRTDR